MNDLSPSAPALPRETLISTVWPTIGATAAGRFVGALANIRIGWMFFTVGNLMALATIPISVTVFCWQLLPIVCRRYALTNRRIVIQKGLSAVEGPCIRLDEFDAIEVRVRIGQKWLRTGELIFLRNDEEVFHLSGVGRPEIFRTVCLKARTALVAMREINQQPAAVGV